MAKNTYKKTKRYQKGKKYIKKKYNKTKALVQSVKKGGFPDTYFTPLVYTQTGLGFGSTTTPGSTRSIALNDPTNGNTVSPQGWDILKLVYDVNLVHYSKIKVTFSNLSTTIPYKAVIVPVDNDSDNITFGAALLTAGQFEALCQSPYAKVFHLSALGGGKDVITCKHGIKVAKLSGDGMKKLTPSYSRFLMNTGSSNSSTAYTVPTASYSWIYGVLTVSGANSSVNNVYADVEVTYYNQFLEKLNVIQ